VRSFLVLLLVVLLSFSVSAVVIGSCPINITDDSTLSGNISNSTSCITIASNNVSLDCLGFTISGNNTGFGIVAENVTNISIENCIVDSFVTNIRLFNVSNSSFSNNTILNSTGASFSLDLGSNVSIFNNNASTNVSPAWLVSNSSNLTFQNNSGAAIFDLINHSTFSDSMGAGLVFSNLFNATITNNSGTGILGAGISFFNISNSTFTNNTGFSASFAGLMFDNCSFSNLTENFGRTASGFGIVLASSNRNYLRNNLGVSYSDPFTFGFAQASMLFNSSSNNTLLNNTFLSNSSSAIHFYGGSGDNALYITILGANNSWILSDALSSGNNITDTYFNNSFGTIRSILNTTVPVSINVSTAVLNVSLNYSFLNASNISFLNLTSQIILRGLNFSDADLFVDPDGTGVFTSCDPPLCTEVSYSGGVFVFVVTSFSGQSAGAASSGGSGGSGGGSSGGGAGGGGGGGSSDDAFVCPAYCGDARYADISVCQTSVCRSNIPVEFPRFNIPEVAEPAPVPVSAPVEVAAKEPEPLPDPIPSVVEESLPDLEDDGWAVSTSLIVMLLFGGGFVWFALYELHKPR